MKFREHRSLLDEAMETVVDLQDYAALLAHVQGIAAHWPTHPPITDETLHIEPYGYDKRIGWDTYIVTLDNYGVLGFTDGHASAGGDRG